MRFDEFTENKKVIAYNNVVYFLTDYKAQEKAREVNDEISRLLPNSSVRIDYIEISPKRLTGFVFWQGELDVSDCVALLKDIYREEADWGFVENYFIARNKGKRARLAVNPLFFNGNYVVDLINREIMVGEYPASCVASLQRFCVRLNQRIKADCDKLVSDVLADITSVAENDCRLLDFDVNGGIDYGKLIR